MNDFQNLKTQEEKLRRDIKDKAILNALNLAKEAHKGQKRDEGDPYIIHPIRIGNILTYDLGIKDKDILIAGLLHDVIEDTSVTTEEIERKFGKKVSDMVSSLTRNKDKETKKEKFEKTLYASEEIRLLKACDWLDNLRSFVYRTDRGERWQRHLKEAQEMYIPLAKATGNKWLITEMEKAYSKVLRIRK